MNDVAGALADCDKACEVEPKNPAGYEYRAWIMASCPEAKFRDGKKAVEEATRACGLMGWQSPLCLETMAAAAAETGDFEAAVKWESRAVECLTDDAAKGQFRERLELFRKKQPYRDLPSKIDDRQASHSPREVSAKER